MATTKISSRHFKTGIFGQGVREAIEYCCDNLLTGPGSWMYVERAGDLNEWCIYISGSWKDPSAEVYFRKRLKLSTTQFILRDRDLLNPDQVLSRSWRDAHRKNETLILNFNTKTSYAKLIAVFEALLDGNEAKKIYLESNDKQLVSIYNRVIGAHVDPVKTEINRARNALIDQEKEKLKKKKYDIRCQCDAKLSRLIHEAEFAVQAEKAELYKRAEQEYRDAIRIRPKKCTSKTEITA